MPHEEMLAAVERYYSGKLAAHGPSAQGVDWNSEESQELRFDQLAALFRDERGAFTVNDLGCGYGAFAAYLHERGIDAEYTGYDVSDAMLAAGRAAFADRAGVRFCHGRELGRADYSIASGVFNVKLEADEAEWRRHVDETIDELHGASGKGFAFNMLTSYSDADKRRNDLFYGDPTRYFDLCKRRYSRDVALLHDYGLWEFTIIVRHEG